MLRLSLFASLAVGLSGTGCDSDTEEVTATASESASSTGDMPTSTGGSSGTTASMSGTMGSSATTVDATETGHSESSETGSLSACSDATLESNCRDTASSSCAWFPTSVVALEATTDCEELGAEGGHWGVEGHCLEVDRQEPECAGFIPTCPDGTAVLFRSSLKSATIELLAVDDVEPCEIPPEFEACQVNSDPKPGSEPSYFPADCECACEG